MANTYDYVQDIIGMDPNAQTNPIHKLEPEFVPGADMFGIGDKAETLELIDVLKGNSINRINICFPLDANDEALIKHTITAIQDILMGRIHVSMSNINTIDNVKFLQKECGNGISYFSKAAKVPDVEEYCRVESIPFLPVASNGKDFLQRIAEGYRVVKAYPFGENKLIDVIKDPTYAELLYTPAGGIKPVIMDPQGNPKEVDEFFLKCAGLKNVINICTTHPTKCLNKESNNNPLETFNSYLQLVSKQ